MTKKYPKLDILAFGPHPDDVEFGCSGLLIKATKKGYKTGIVDMSLAELSTNGNVELRLKEAEKAREIIGAKVRENLRIPNNFFINSKEIQDKIIEPIRKYRPELVLVPYFFDRHPDHENGSKLIREALFNTGLTKYETGLPKHRPPYVLFYMMWYEFTPSLVVNIDDEWKTKLDSILAYDSQFSKANGNNLTIDNDDRTLKWVEARARNWGFAINKTFGEPYLSLSPLGIDDPFNFHPNFF